MPDQRNDVHHAAMDFQQYQSQDDREHLSRFVNDLAEKQMHDPTHFKQFLQALNSEIKLCNMEIIGLDAEKHVQALDKHDHQTKTFNDHGISKMLVGGTNITTKLSDGDRNLESKDRLIIEDRKPNSNEMKVKIEAGGRSYVLRYDAQGSLVAFKDPYGELFDKAGDKWVSRTNLVQPEGVRIAEDSEHNVTRTDIATGIKTTFINDGKEFSEYPSGGKTLTITNGKHQTVTVDSANLPLRTLELEDGQLTRYTDGDHNTYSKEGKGWAKTDSHGYHQDFTGTLRADIAGNVVIIDRSRKGQSDYIKAEWNNGQITNRDQDRPKGCGPVQETPLDVNLAENIERAIEQRPPGPFTALDHAEWFRNMVRHHGEWDFKQRGAQYEDFGNFHYGVVGGAIGMPLKWLLQEAGRAQIEDGNSKPGWGYPGSRVHYLFNTDGGVAPYGDDPADQEQIKRGYEYYLRSRSQR